MFRNPRVVAAVVLAAILLLAGVVPAAVAATPWQLVVGVSTPDQAAQANFFIPNEITIHAGDSIMWTWNSGEIHTVAFGAYNPSLGDPFSPYGGTGNAATFDGVSPVNSGIHSAFFGGAYTVTFANAGDYSFHCLVHPSMSGEVHVRAAGQSLPHSPSWYVQQAQATSARLVNRAFAIEVQGQQIAANAGPRQVQAGYGQFGDDGATAVLRFQSNRSGQPLNVHVGQTVTWTNRDGETPHTITFNGSFADPTAPVGVDPGTPLHATMTSFTKPVNSGFIGAIQGLPTQGQTFSVTFMAPGLYNYHCELHDDLGMTGQINVTN